MDLLSIVGVVAFIVALLLSVMIHEAGHYLTAKRFGMKVTEFFLGFGKKIWSTQRGETEFGIKAIPAGGYCKIVGMSPREVLSEEDQPRAFIRGSITQRLIVLGAGSFLHFVLGFILIFTLFVVVGTTQTLNKVDQVFPCILQEGESECSPNSLRSPASIVGIAPGDEIISVVQLDQAGISQREDLGQGEMRWRDIVEVIRSSPGKQLVLDINRNGEVIQITILVGTRISDGQEFGVIGVINEVGNVRSAPVQGLRDSASFVKDVVTGSLKALAKLPTYIPALLNQTFGGEMRDPEGLVGIVGVARTTGEATSSERLDVNDKIGFFLVIVAGLNIFVGVFNLLPILPLDGGHMAVAITDGVKRWWARQRGKPAPKPVDVEKLTPITLVVVAAMISLTLLLLLADIINPVKLGF